MIWVHDLNPVAFMIPGIHWPVHWYGVVYALGGLLGLWALPRLWRAAHGARISKESLENLVLGTVLCGVIGGRFFEFLFYEWDVLINAPQRLFRIWEGGMSIHGGLLGGGSFMAWWAHKNGVSFWKVADVIVLLLSYVLIFGRVANFINAELWGVPTNGSWGVVFPFQDTLPRHPSPLYHATKNVLIALTLSFLWHKKAYQKPSTITAIFLMLYGTFRSILHIWREPTASVFGVSVGQAMSMLMIIFGIVLFFTQAQKKAS